MKNYYRILGVGQNATEDDIKHSFRTLAKRYHPDVNPDDKTAARRFADINEAYDVLSDPDKRAKYNEEIRIATAQANAARGAQQQTATANNAAWQAQFVAQVQAQVQAQLQPVRDRAYKDGYATGYRSGSQNAQQSAAKINARIKALTTENDKLKISVDAYRRDRAAIEQELFDRDREISKLREQTQELESQLEWTRRASVSAAAGNNGNASETAATASADADRTRDPLRTRVADETRRVETLMRELEANAPAETVSDDTTLAQNKRRKQIKQELDKLERTFSVLAAELKRMDEENKRRAELAKTEKFITALEMQADDWAKKLKEDRKLAKNTHYGTLGVLIWATDAEVDAAYALLEQQLQNREDEASRAKFERVKEAYKAIVTEERRKEYNKTIGVSEEKVAYERQLIKENAKAQAEYRNSVNTKAFWKRFDELTSLALAGNAQAQNTLGEIYYNGKYIKRDLTQAIYWFREAFAQRNPAAIYNLGICYQNGDGVGKNKSIAQSLLRQADNLGYKPKA